MRIVECAGHRPTVGEKQGVPMMDQPSGKVNGGPVNAFFDTLLFDMRMCREIMTTNVDGGGDPGAGSRFVGFEWCRSERLKDERKERAIAKDQRHQRPRR